MLKDDLLEISFEQSFDAIKEGAGFLNGPVIGPQFVRQNKESLKNRVILLLYVLEGGAGVGVDSRVVKDPMRRCGVPFGFGGANLESDDEIRLFGDGSLPFIGQGRARILPGGGI